ncbi:hypothetical protein FS749_005005 [Ceratobasidium sp. UAMH 11750]|nr:hypothetical protein FS749_005005 [Ceratobasidium sp. UAMH 11750]
MDQNRNQRYSGQTPQCEGRKQDRLLFRTQFASHKGMIRLFSNPMDNTFHIKVGSACGILKGTELDVYSGNISGTSPPLVRLVVIEATATEATLRIHTTDPMSIDLPLNSHAAVVKYTGQEMRIRIDNVLKLSRLWQEVINALQSQPIDIVWTEPDEPSNLLLVPTKGGVMLQRRGPFLTELGPRNIVLQQELRPLELTRRLGAITRFHFHLQRRNPDSPLDDDKGTKLIRMKLIELKNKKSSHPWGPKEYDPVTDDPDDMFGDNTSAERVACLQAASEKRYGLQLTNRSSCPLFAWVIYFDLEDYSINILYNPPARDAPPPLSNDGTELAVGYGSSVVKPLQVNNRGYSLRECGVFMLFVSDKWVDMSHIEQPPIFEPEEDAGAGGQEWDNAEAREQAPAHYAEHSSQEQDCHMKLDSSVWDVSVVGVSIS